MNKETTQLLQQLADKLGTTTEYLWGVLIRQAPIDATTTLIQFFLILLMGYGIWRVHKRCMAPYKAGAHHSVYYESDGAGPAVAIVTVFWLVLFILCFCCLSDVINGYFNPEYWALNKILDKV